MLTAMMLIQVKSPNEADDSHCLLNERIAQRKPIDAGCEAGSFTAFGRELMLDCEFHHRWDS